METKVGRPPKYKTAEELQERIDAYFYEHCKKEDEIPNVLGLVVFLGFSDRCSLSEYERKPEFTHTIKRAKTRIYNEKIQLAMRGAINPTIFIFDAVNNHGMINTRSKSKNDNQYTTEEKGPVPVTVTFVDPETYTEEEGS